MEHWSIRASKRVMGAEKSELQAVAKQKFKNKSWALVWCHGFHPLVWSSTKGTILEALALEVPTLELKFGSCW